MLGMFNSVKPYVVPKPKVDVPRPDNAVFRLHYKASSLTLRWQIFHEVHISNAADTIFGRFFQDIREYLGVVHQIRNAECSAYRA